MGYTHYFTQVRSIPVAQWSQITTDIAAILSFVKHESGIPLAGSHGDAGTFPLIDAETISFNGVGDDAHETFYISRKMSKEAARYAGDNPNWNFCKTAQKPYDLAVTAVLSYLATITRKDVAGEIIMGSEAFRVTSDGDANDWLLGVDLVKQAVPSAANMVDIPMPILQAGRWVSPWLHLHSKHYDFRFCVNGKAYAFKTGDEANAYRFNSHQEAGEWLMKTRYAGGMHHENNIWDATGSFNDARYARLAAHQTRELKKLVSTLRFDWVAAERKEAPPAFIRPGDMPKEAIRYAYSIADLIKQAESV